MLSMMKKAVQHRLRNIMKNLTHMYEREKTYANADFIKTDTKELVG